MRKISSSSNFCIAETVLEERLLERTRVATCYIFVVRVNLARGAGNNSCSPSQDSSEVLNCSRGEGKKRQLPLSGLFEKSSRPQASQHRRGTTTCLSILFVLLPFG
jgi:hypothetical protein